MHGNFKGTWPYDNDIMLLFLNTPFEGLTKFAKAYGCYFDLFMKRNERHEIYHPIVPTYVIGCGVSQGLKSSSIPTIYEGQYPRIIHTHTVMDSKNYSCVLQ